MSHITSMLAGSPVMARQGCVWRYGRAGSVSDGGSAFGDKSCRLNVGEDALAVAYYGDTTMATADNTTKEKKMSKTVNIVCYLKADSDLEQRAVMDSLDVGNDYYEMGTTGRDRWYAVTPSGVRQIDEDVAEVLRDAEGENLMVAHRVEESECHKEGAYDFKRRFKDSVFEGIDVTPPSVDDQSWYNSKVETDTGVIFKGRADTPSRMGLLKHPSEVEDPDTDGVWEDKDADLWAMTLTLKVDSVSPTLFRFFDNQVIPDIKEACAKNDWVQRTRVMDCSKEMTEEGACYDVF